MSVLIAPSLLSADFLELGKAIEMINHSAADWFHVDVMDGQFVPNISFGFPVMQGLKKLAQKPLDVHLMIERPELYIERFAAAGAHHISVHAEATVHLHRALQMIRNAGCKTGVAINPGTPVQVVEDLLHDIDIICLMGVNPGFGGQSYIPQTTTRIARLRMMIKEAGSKTLIEVDGGVSPDNAQELIAAGANVLVAGSAVFAAADPAQAIKQLKSFSVN